jgi:hypothetical protein
MEHPHRPGSIAVHDLAHPDEPAVSGVDTHERAGHRAGWRNLD